MGGETRVLHGASESLAEIFADAEHAAAAAFATAEPGRRQGA